MDKKDFRKLLSEAFEKNNKEIDKKFDLQAARIKKDVREEFAHFVDVAIIPQFDRIYAELKDIRSWVNDLSHRQDQILRTLEKHEDRFDYLGRRQDKMLEILEKHEDRLDRLSHRQDRVLEILEKHGKRLERIEAKL